jgi:hypothetical protein
MASPTSLVMKEPLVALHASKYKTPERQSSLYYEIGSLILPSGIGQRERVFARYLRKRLFDSYGHCFRRCDDHEWAIDNVHLL